MLERRMGNGNMSSEPIKKEGIWSFFLDLYDFFSDRAVAVTICSRLAGSIGWKRDSNINLFLLHCMCWSISPDRLRIITSVNLSIWRVRAKILCLGVRCDGFKGRECMRGWRRMWGTGDGGQDKAVRATAGRHVSTGRWTCTKDLV